MTTEDLRKAIEAAGKELRDVHGWTLDSDDDGPVSESLFARVVFKHIAPLIDPAAMEAARKARIAALRAELEALERA